MVVAASAMQIKSMRNKVPEATLVFWTIKILATTVGETCADFLAVRAGLGAITTAIAMSACLVLALGILVELTEEMKSSALLTELLLKAHELGMQIRFTAISEDEYGAWVRAQSKRRFLLTLLGPTITAEHLTEASGIAARNGLNIDRIDRLSGRTPLDSDAGSGRVCVELAVSGNRPTKMRFAASLCG